ncbi:tastin-like protein [Cricetulus griseus]|nr:tastin-like protein [Cricetulus griseus]
MAGCDVTRLASAETSQSQGWRILQTGEAAAAETQKIGEKAERVEVTPRGSWRAAMTTLHTRKEPLLRGVSPTPSKIPVLSQRCPDFSSVKSCSQDRENQDPRRLSQKVSTPHPLIGSAAPRSKTLHHTEKSQKLGITRLRNPLEELKPSCGGANVEHVSHTQTEASGAIEFVADPAALATILSGEGVKSCPLGRQSSLAQRVLVRGSKGGTTQKGKGARSSAYLAPRTPIHQLDPARASCFSRLEGSGSRGHTLFPQRIETLSLPSGSSHPTTRPSLQEIRRETCDNSRTSANQASRLLLKTPVQPEHEAVPHSDERGRALLGLAQRVPLRGTGERMHTRTSYSSLKQLTIRPKTQCTPLRSLPRVQQTQWLSGLSPHSSPEEPAMPWEQIAVRLFDQEGCITLQKGSGKPSVASTSGPHPSKTPNHQELKMQRISLLQQLLQQEIEGLAVDKCAPLNGGSALEMTKLQPLLADISKTLSAPEHNSGTSLLGLSKHSGVTEPYLAEECPSSLAPRTLALRQRLRACLTAIHCFHEARLDDECAFYTSRTPPPGPTRVCTNPVATLLEWQDALRFIPVGSVVPQASPS